MMAVPASEQRTSAASSGGRSVLIGLIGAGIQGSGAGGAGSAVAHAALTLAAQRLSIVDLDRQRAAALARDLCLRFGAQRAAAVDDPAQVMVSADGLINASPIGMAKHPGLPIAAKL